MEGQNPGQNVNKFVPSPGESKRDTQEPISVGAEKQRYPEAGIVKKRRRDRRADKVKDRIRGILSDPAVSKVTIAWHGGEEKTFDFARKGEKTRADGDKVCSLRLFHSRLMCVLS